MTGFLLDTNVVSESARRRPEPRVAAWWSEQRSAELFVASITIGELVRGARKIPERVAARRYDEWIRHFVIPRFEGRILPFDDRAAFRWGEMMAAADRAGRKRPPLDAQLAAIAALQSLTLVTRNVRDFQDAGIPILNPWLP